MSRTVIVLSVLAMSTVLADIGTIDTVGGTTYDWQYGGCAFRYIAHATGHGIHAVWMWSNETLGVNADRNFRYNLYDFSTRQWAWIDTHDFMLSGWGIFGQRAGYGNIDADPATGGLVATAQVGNIRPIVGRDIEFGAGIFEFCDGSPVLDGYLWPLIAVGQNRTIHMACVDDATRDNHWYTRVATWCNWDVPVLVTPIAPTFPSHNVSASKVSDKVCQMWIKCDMFPYSAYFRRSSDGGTTWGSIVDLGYPPAFGSDTACSYYITSSMPFYDRQDRLHIVVDVIPVINDTVFIAPVEIWHWCESNSPVWSRVHRADADPRGNWNPGINAAFACRPSIGEDTRGNLFVSWEQFDTTNVEPLENLLRGDIWLSGSPDNGQTWRPGMMISTQNTTSHRFPCMVDLAIPGGQDPDTVMVLYEDDSVAGFRAGSSPVGPWSHNPYIAHRVPVDLILSGVAEPRRNEAGSQILKLRVQNPTRQRVAIQYQLPAVGEASLRVFDAAGRCVATLAAGGHAAGRHGVNWDATSASPGIYYITLRTAMGLLTEKTILAR